MKEIIKVQYVNQPKAGKKMGSVKTEDGRYFDAWPDKLALFDLEKIGDTYEVELESREYNGKTYYKIASAKPVNGNSAPATANGHTNGNGTRSTSDQIRWQTCLKCAAEIYREASVTGQSAAEYVIEVARELYTATPVEVTAESTSDNGGDW